MLANGAALPTCDPFAVLALGMTGSQLRPSSLKVAKSQGKPQSEFWRGLWFRVKMFRLEESVSRDPI